MGTAFQTLNDEQVVALVQAGDRHAERYLLRKYRPLVWQRARSYFLNGADREDLLQEGLIGLHKAIRDFKTGQDFDFKRFANVCIVRSVITAVRTATRQKNLPLSGYAPLDANEVVEQPLELLNDRHDPIEEAVLHEDGMDWLKRMLAKHLSGFEWQVLALYLKGQSYREISAALEKNTKAIDNALARIKEKGRLLQLQVVFS